jgi:hypothetical protein
MYIWNGNDTSFYSFDFRQFKYIHVYIYIFFFTFVSQSPGVPYKFLTLLILNYMFFNKNNRPYSMYRFNGIALSTRPIVFKTDITKL